MKKIVGIIGMAAMLASAAFALDVSASLKVSGEILNGHADHNDSTFGMFKTDTGAADFAVASFSAGDDVAGASFGIKFKSFGVTAKSTGYDDKPYYEDAEATFLTFDPTDGKVWFKPFNDMLNGALTLTLGNVGNFATGSIELKDATVGFLTSFKVADLGLGVDFIMDTKNEKGYSYYKMREAGVPDGLDLIGLKASFANETIGKVEAGFTYDHIDAWKLNVGLAYTMPKDLVEGLTADLGLGFFFSNQEIKQHSAENVKKADYWKYVATPKQKLNVGYAVEDKFSVSLSEELNFGYTNKIMKYDTLGKYGSTALSNAGLTVEEGKKYPVYQGVSKYKNVDKDGKAYDVEAADKVLKPSDLALTLNGSYNLMDDLVVSAKVGAKFMFNEWAKKDAARAAYKVQNTDVNVKLASSNADFFKPYVEFDYANWFGYYETTETGKKLAVADAYTTKVEYKDNTKDDTNKNKVDAGDTWDATTTYTKGGSNDKGVKTNKYNPTLKINAGISGTIGVMDWTLAMENTFTMNMNTANHKDFNTVYDVKVPFTCSVKF